MIAVLAILIAAVIIVLNPGEILAQARDSQRLSDMSTLKSALNLFIVQSNGAPALGSCDTGGRCTADVASGSGPFTAPAGGPQAESVDIMSAVLPQGIAQHSCVSMNSKIYCFGGASDSGYSDKIVEYNPATNATTTMNTALPFTMWIHSCASMNSKIYCFGGSDDNSALDKIVEYDPTGDTIVTKIAVLPSARDFLSCAPGSNGKIYCFGGQNAGGVTYLNQIVEYDPAATDGPGAIVTKTAVLPSARAYLSCTPINNKIYCFGGGNIGGDNSGFFNQIVEYDPAATDGPGAIVTKTAVLPQLVGASSCTSINNKIYCFGGETSGWGRTNQIVEYDPAATDGPGAIAIKTVVLPSAIGWLSCASASGKAYCFGGADADWNTFNQIVSYTPASSGGGSSSSGCAATSTSRLVDGTGWMDVNFSGMSTGSPIPILPIDPTNNPNYFYGYACEKTHNTFEFSSRLESSKYRDMMTKDNGTKNTCGPAYTENTCFYETGSAMDL